MLSSILRQLQNIEINVRNRKLLKNAQVNICFLLKVFVSLLGLCERKQKEVRNAIQRARIIGETCSHNLINFCSYIYEL